MECVVVVVVVLLTLLKGTLGIYAPQGPTQSPLGSFSQYWRS